MRMPRHFLCQLAIGVLAVPAFPMAGHAQPATPPGASPACPATPAPLPPAFSAWPNATALTSAPDKPGLAMTQIAPGEAENLALHPTAEVHYVSPPAKPGGAGSFGGMVGVHVTAAGTYRVALGAPAWIDLVANGATLPATGHGHGPDCSGIRKIVDFALQPGDYVLQVAASATPSLTVLVVPQADNMQM